MKLKKTLITTLTVLVACYIAYATIYYFAQTAMIFQAEKANEKMMVYSVHDQYPGIRVFWPEADGQTVEAWYLPPVYYDPILDEYIPEIHDRGPAPLMVVGHGNAALIDDWPGQLTEVREAGMGVLLVEYPGYGRSSGTPGQKIITQLFAAAFDSVVSWSVADTNKVVALGRSLGGGVACAFAADHKTEALILVSTFTSVRSFSTDYGLPGFIVKHPFDNEAVLRVYDKPVLLVHATGDWKIPYKHAIALSEVSQTDTLITRENDGHDTLQGHWREFWDETGLPFLRDAEVTE
jgi:uncharacterized protein